MNYKQESDGSITITMNLRPEGSMLEQEEQIASALTQAGLLATKLSLEKFDTNGQPIIVENKKYTTRGQEKKDSKRRTGK